MKKLITIATVVQMAISVFGWTPAESNVFRCVQMFVDGYSTNQVFASHELKTCISNVEFTSRVDGMLVGTPPINFLRRAYANPFPRTYAAIIEDLRKDLPFLVKDGSMCWPAGNQGKIVYKLVLLDRIGRVCNHERLSREVSVVVRNNLRKHLRSQGKKIVAGPDGKDPCQPYIDDVTAALNAPRYEGLSNALSRCGVDIYVPVKYRAALDDRKITTLTNDIFIGNIPFTTEWQCKIRFALGLKEYNKFVERYNGGSN